VKYFFTIFISVSCFLCYSCAQNARRENNNVLAITNVIRDAEEFTLILYKSGQIINIIDVNRVFLLSNVFEDECRFNFSFRINYDDFVKISNLEASDLTTTVNYKGEYLFRSNFHFSESLYYEVEINGITACKIIHRIKEIDNK